MANPRLRDQRPELAKQADANRWSLPLVAIDDEIWFQGYIDHRAIVDVIEKKRGSA